MSNGFKAIATTYKGISFRSRFESEVAMLLDKLDLEWQYEPKSFLLSGGHYMPDFFVPSMNMWVEARGYDGKDWQIEQFYEHVKTLPAEYLVIKYNYEMVITKGFAGVVFDTYGTEGHAIKLSTKNGHLVINDRGIAQSVMEWPGFDNPYTFDLANMLRVERSTTELQSIDQDFYSSVMIYLNGLSKEAKAATQSIEREILQDTAKSERNSLSKIVDYRTKKIMRKALRQIRISSEVDITGMASEEGTMYERLMNVIAETRESIFSNAFKPT